VECSIEFPYEKLKKKHEKAMCDKKNYIESDSIGNRKIGLSESIYVHVVVEERKQDIGMIGIS